MKKAIYNVEDLLKQKPQLRVTGKNPHYDLANNIVLIYNSFIKTIYKNLPDDITNVIRSDGTKDKIDVIEVGKDIVFMNLESYTPDNWMVGRKPIPKRIVMQSEEKEPIIYISGLLEHFVEETL